MNSNINAHVFTYLSFLQIQNSRLLFIFKNHRNKNTSIEITGSFHKIISEVVGEKSVFNFTLYSFIRAFVNTSMLLQAENNALYSILCAIKAIQKQNPSIRVAINCKNIIMILSGPISSISVVTSRRATINTLRSTYIRRLRWISLMLLHKMV